MSLKDLFIKPDKNSKQQGNGAQNRTSPKREEVREEPKEEVRPKEEPKAEETINIDAIIPEESVTEEETADTAVEVSNVMKKRLWETLVSRNLPGPDMLELKNYSASLESMGLPQDKRYEAAFKMLKAQYPDFTKEKLLKSIDTYIGFVNEEIESGRNQFDAKMSRTIGNQQKKLEEMEKENEFTIKQIEELTKKNETLSNEIAKLKVEITTASKEISHDKQVFMNSANSVICDLITVKNDLTALNFENN